MQQAIKASETAMSDSEKLEILLKRLEFLTQQVEEIRKEMQRMGAHFQPLIQ